MKQNSGIRLMVFLAALAGLIVTLTGTAAAMGPRRMTLALSLTGLEDLGPGWAYEGWLIVNDAPVSTGVFTIDGGGALSQRRFTIDVNRREATAFVLTIEPHPDPDPAPSATHVLAGDVRGNRALLRVEHPAALGDNFRGAAGSFLLGVPTDQSGATPYTNGIWYVDPAAGPGPSLNLPSLPAGWIYEGWVVGPNGPVSTGTFMHPAGGDSDAGGPYAGPDPAPPFPGQDFVSPGMSLIDYAAVISIEPYPDNSSAPFAFKPLVKMGITDPGTGGVLQSMDNNARGLARGVVRLIP